MAKSNGGAVAAATEHQATADRHAAANRQAWGDTLSRRRIGFILASVMLGMLLSALDQTVVGTALPKIVQSLNGFEHYVWVTTGYLLATAASMPIWGKLSDAYGRKRFYAARHGHLRRGVGPVRPGARHDRPHRLPGPPGPGRGRHDAHLAGDRRRHLPARPARQVHGHPDERLRPRDDRRPAARRLDHRQLQLALGLLRQPAGGHRGHRLLSGRAARSRHPAQAPPRLRGVGAARRRGRPHAARVHLGRHHLSVAVVGGRRRVGLLGGRLGRVLLLGDARQGAGHQPAPVQ